MPTYVKLRVVTERGLRDLHVPTPFPFWDAAGVAPHANTTLMSGGQMFSVHETCEEIAALLDIDRRH